MELAGCRGLPTCPSNVQASFGMGTPRIQVSRLPGLPTRSTTPRWVPARLSTPGSSAGWHPNVIKVDKSQPGPRPRAPPAW